MASVSTYLNFPGTTEAAFAFYRSVFGTDLQGPILRWGDMPPGPGMPECSAQQKQLVMHMELPILAGHLLMGTDSMDGMGEPLHVGNHAHITLHPDTRAEADRLFAALSDGGRVTMPMAEMFWGDYFGSWVDRFGVQWMINCASKT